MANIGQQRVMDGKRRERAAGTGNYPVAGWISATIRAGYGVLGVSGLAGVMQRRQGVATGVILRMERVRPRHGGRFQPLRSHEITPRFLHRVVAALRRWGYEIVTIERLHQRLLTADFRDRFACLTFDGGYRDTVTHALPVLRAHGVPCVVYVPTGFPDRIAEPWWLGLEQVIAKERRFGMVMEGREVRFDCATVAAKYAVFERLWTWLCARPSDAEMREVARDLCARHRVDLNALADEHFLDWADIARLAADPLVTLGTATVHLPMLSKLGETAAAREMRMGQSVLEAATGRKPTHFAYPFGSAGTFGARDVTLAEHIGFATAVTAEPRALVPNDRRRLTRLPRLTVDGERDVLGWLRLRLVGPEAEDAAVDLER